MSPDIEPRCDAPTAYEGQCAAVRRVLAAIDRDPGHAWTIDELARVARFSKFHFTRFFTEIVGVSPGVYLTEYRFEQAKQLLTTTPVTVTDLTVQLGYTSIGCFSAAFSRRVGVPPTWYRRGRRAAPRDTPGPFSDDVMSVLAFLRYDGPLPARI